MKFTTLTDEARIALGGMADIAGGLVQPTVRLGVTGLSRAGKTVFITALIHNLIHGGRLPLFDAHATGRIKRAYLQPQPDDDLPRFAYEDHVENLLAGPDRAWPASTTRISQLRLTIGGRQARRPPVLPNGASTQDDAPRTFHTGYINHHRAAPITATETISPAVKRVESTSDKRHTGEGHANAARL